MPILLTSKMATSDCSCDLITSVQYLYGYIRQFPNSFCSENGHITPQEKPHLCRLLAFEKRFETLYIDRVTGITLRGKDKRNSYQQPMAEDIKTTTRQ